MLRIYEYLDYRKFLADYYAEKRIKNPKFSYRTFADLAGFKARDFIQRVIHGKKNLSLNSVLKVSKALGLNEQESMYLNSIVNYAQAKNIKEKTFYFNQLSLIKEKKSVASKAQLLRKDQFELFSQWYHPVIQLIIEQSGFTGDYKTLSETLTPHITPGQAKKSIALLKNLGLILENEDGSLRSSHSSFITEQEVTSLALVNFYKTCTKFAAHAIETMPKDKRNASGLTMGIDFFACPGVI